jgi:hypothetical protein
MVGIIIYVCAFLWGRNLPREEEEAEEVWEEAFDQFLVSCFLFLVCPERSDGYSPGIIKF